MGSGEKEEGGGGGVSPECNTSILTLLNQHLVLTGQALGDIGEQGVGEAPEPALPAGRVPPGQVGVDCVCASRYHLQTQVTPHCDLYLQDLVFAGLLRKQLMRP